MQNIIKISLLAFAAAVCSCSDWTDEQPVDIDVKTPLDGEQYQQYLKTLREYKLTDHYVVYVQLDNAPEVSKSEQDFMRSLPDSIDMVALTSSANLSDFDIEDLPVMKEKGIKVLYLVDYNAYKQGSQSLDSFLDECIEGFNRHGFDGFTVAADVDLSTELEGQHADAVKIIEKLGAVAGGGKQSPLIFQGNPLFVPEASRGAFDYYILVTFRDKHYIDVLTTVRYAQEYLGLPDNKLLLSAGTTGVELTGYITNIDGELRDSIPEMAWNTLTMGPLAGLAVMYVGDDYYHTSTIYRFTRWAINIFNHAN